MSQCNIIKGLKYLCIHIIHSANGDFLRIRADRTCHKLMCHQNIDRCSVKFHLFNAYTNRLRIGKRLLNVKEMTHQCRLDKGKKVNVQRRLFVFQLNGFNGTGKSRRNIDIRGFHQPPAEGKPLR